MLVGINGDELDALLIVLAGKFDESRGVQFGERAFGAKERDDDGLFVGPIGEGMFGAEIVLELEIGDLFADGGGRDSGAARMEHKTVGEIQRCQGQQRIDCIVFMS